MFRVDGLPVFECCALDWGAAYITAEGVFVDSLPDFERRLRWAARKLPIAVPSREPAVAIPTEAPRG